MEEQEIDFTEGVDLKDQQIVQLQKEIIQLESNLKFPLALKSVVIRLFYYKKSYKK